jgi:DNA-binding response OmpR family regulator
MLSIVVVEDNDELRETFVSALTQSGYAALGFDSAEAATEGIGARKIPGEDGLSLCGRLRQIYLDIGIVMVTARGRTDDKKAGYESGADIYLTKPVSLDELLGAIKALARRLSPRSGAGQILLDVGKRLLRGPGGEVALRQQEAAVLAALSRAADRKLETWQVLDVLEMEGKAANKNAIGVLIFRINQKLEQAGAGSRAIRSIRGFGYQLCAGMALG